MKRDAVWLVVVVVVIALGFGMKTREKHEVLITPSPGKHEVLITASPRPEASATYNISGAALGMTADRLLEVVGEPESRQQQGPVNEYTYLEQSGRQTRVYLDKEVLMVLGYNLKRGDELLLEEGTPVGRLREILGPPAYTRKRRDVVDYVYLKPPMKITVVAGKTQEIGLGRQLLQPANLNPERDYQLCARELVKQMEMLKAEYGQEGVVPMSVIQAHALHHRCPAGKKPTMSATGTQSGGGISMRDLTLFCRGENHKAAGVPEHHPEVHSVRGLSSP